MTKIAQEAFCQVTKVSRLLRLTTRRLWRLSGKWTTGPTRFRMTLMRQAFNMTTFLWMRTLRGTQTLSTTRLGHRPTICLWQMIAMAIILCAADRRSSQIRSLLQQIPFHRKQICCLSGRFCPVASSTVKTLRWPKAICVPAILRQTP